MALLARLGSSWRRRALALILASAALAVGYFGWFRDSSLVAIHDVRVEGVSSSDRERIVAALTDAARGMTTLHVRADRLESAVRGFPTVAAVSADPSFPNGVTIQVTERQPVLFAEAGGRRVPVAADASLLPGLSVGGDDLPTLRVDSLPPAGRLTGDALQEARVVGAAPAPLRPLIEGISLSSDYGVVLTMRGGIELRFGDRRAAASKWAAVATILADPRLTSLAHVDVRVPERPAVG